MNSLATTIDTLYQQESRKVFATLVRLLGDMELAEDATQEAFSIALQQWNEDALPANPTSWLISAGRNNAIDKIRRNSRFREIQGDVERRYAAVQAANEQWADQDIHDDQLRLIFTCCHPAIDPLVQVALTLREVCGLTTEEIASAFLTSKQTMAQRIVRGKAKIRNAKIPYVLPSGENLTERVESVLTVIYLVFNEGYSASAGETVVRHNLTHEAIRLARLLQELLPDSEVRGLLALMLLHESRRLARTNERGDIVLLEDQDRSLWNQELIAEGRQLVRQALANRRIGFYSVQAAIAAVHAEAATPVQTDWAQIVALYEMLLQIAPSPVIRLNQAVAIAMHDGPAAGLEILEELAEHSELANYHLFHSARGEFLRRLGRSPEAQAAYATALKLARQEPERRFLQSRLDALERPAGSA